MEFVLTSPRGRFTFTCKPYTALFGAGRGMLALTYGPEADFSFQKEVA